MQVGVLVGAQVDADGHFTFKEMLPGKYDFKVNTFGQYIESMRSGTIDVLADGLEIGSASPEVLRVTLRGGGVTMTVLSLISMVSTAVLVSPSPSLIV